MSQNRIVANLTLLRGSSGSEVRRVFHAARGSGGVSSRLARCWNQQTGAAALRTGWNQEVSDSGCGEGSRLTGEGDSKPLVTVAGLPLIERTPSWRAGTEKI